MTRCHLFCVRSKPKPQTYVNTCDRPKYVKHISNILHHQHQKWILLFVFILSSHWKRDWKDYTSPDWNSGRMYRRSLVSPSMRWVADTRLRRMMFSLPAVCKMMEWTYVELTRHGSGVRLIVLNLDVIDWVSDEIQILLRDIVKSRETESVMTHGWLIFSKMLTFWINHT